MVLLSSGSFHVKAIISWSGSRRFVHTDALILHLVIQEQLVSHQLDQFLDTAAISAVQRPLG